MLTNLLYGAAYSDSSEFEMVMRSGGVPGDSGETKYGR